MFRRVLAQAVACALMAAGPALAAQTSSNGVTTVEVPGGGTVAYAQMPQQKTVKGAMSKVLQYIESRYGARPNISQMLSAKDGNVLGAIYTLTPAQGGKGELSGLALVVSRPNLPLEGAMLTDQSDRFRTTFGAMLDRLTSQASAAEGGSKSAQPAKAGAQSAETKSNGAASGPTGPAKPLTQTDFGTGTVGLPAGWKIGYAHAGEVAAKGPQGESARFGTPITIMDPRSSEARAVGGFARLPYGSDPVATFNAAVGFANRGHKVPTFDFSTVKDVSSGQGGRAFLMVGDVDFHDGKGQVHTWVQMGISAPMMGGYLLTISQVVVPEALANAEAATVAKMFIAYKVNASAAVHDVKVDGAIIQATFAQTMHQIAAINDSGERLTAGMSDMLRDNTVVRDTLLNGHARVSDDLADGLVEADPERFQKVPLSQYIQGIDY